MAEAARQIPLIQIVESDDAYLRERSPLWFEVLESLDWRALRPVAARYYEVLTSFNMEQAGRASAEPCDGDGETRQQATLRLVYSRATMDSSAPALYEAPTAKPSQIRVDPQTVEPGCPPIRIAGRTPKCFFAMLRAFLGMTLRGRVSEPETVDDELSNNPAYARACGFTLFDPRIGYRSTDVPSLRKLEQFDQLMTQSGLWEDLAVRAVRRNLESEVVDTESVMVHDTTHYPARSGMTVVKLEAEEGKQGLNKPRKKSQPRTTKNCRCADREHCGHPWESADEGAGTVVKSGGKKYWAHKASTLGSPGQEVLLDAVAMSDAAAHDSNSLEAHLERLFALYPPLEGRIERVLDDCAADDEDLKMRLFERWEIELMTGVNPRGRKPRTEDLPRGISHITTVGYPVCQQGFPFTLLTVRHDEERFVFRAPKLRGEPVCIECPVRAGCYRGEKDGRQVSIPFAWLPWINPGHPQLSFRYQKQMAARTSIERLHNLMKSQYGDERLSKRGNANFQARLAKTRLGMHVLLAYRAKLARTES
jgi:hypothetical protein